MEAKKNTSKTPKNCKYYYTKASVLRSAFVSVMCAFLFVVFFVCFMVYGGTDRNSSAVYKNIDATEKRPLSMISEIEADGQGRIYTFFRRTFEVNAYDEEGNFKESYQIPCATGENIVVLCDGGIVCDGGYLYVFNEAMDVFAFKDGKAFASYNMKSDSKKCNEILKLYKEKNSLQSVTVKEKTYTNNFVAVVDPNGKIITERFFVGMIFSPFSMIMAILMTVITYLAIRRYNKKVRNEKIKTVFKKSVTVK